MEARKWEELPMDCLVNVFGRVGMESLIVDVPLVCKPWYKATLSPFCWKQLHFPCVLGYKWLCDPFVDKFRGQYPLETEICMTNFVKVVVDRSNGCATMVKLPGCYSKEALIYVAENCSALKKLVLSEEPYNMMALYILIGKFKNLESLQIKDCYLFKCIVADIGYYCESFVALSLVAEKSSNVYIGEEEAMAIVTWLPNIKCLTLRRVFIELENLITILEGCVELVHFVIRDSTGFDEDDEKLCELASHIARVNCTRQSLYFESLVDYDSDDYENCDYCC